MGLTVPASRYPGGVPCAAASAMLMLCALQRWASETLGAALSLAAVALGLLLAAAAPRRAGMR